MFKEISMTSERKVTYEVTCIFADIFINLFVVIIAAQDIICVVWEDAIVGIGIENQIATVKDKRFQIVIVIGQTPEVFVTICWIWICFSELITFNIVRNCNCSG